MANPVNNNSCRIQSPASRITDDVQRMTLMRLIRPTLESTEAPPPRPAHNMDPRQYRDFLAATLQDVLDLLEEDEDDWLEMDSSSPETTTMQPYQTTQGNEVTRQ